MKFSSLALLATAVASLAGARVVTKGAGDKDNVQTRYEIRRLHDKHPNQWNLFILALDKWYTQDFGDSLSYYQIAGIHGVPATRYDGVGPTNGYAIGYCTHDMIIFPAWHRTYMGLFEQQFMTVVYAIVNSFADASEKQMYQQAAATMRFPFFDWAAKPGSGSEFPTFFSDQRIDVADPANPRRTKNIPNPLFQFDFQGQQTANNPFYGNDFRVWGTTLRHPQTGGAGARSDPDRARSVFAGSRQQWQDDVYRLLNNCKDYRYFSHNIADSSNPDCANSLEQIHDWIHGAIGGADNGHTGHMSILAEAAFDPLFWLHHMNVDRLFAMWQTLHSDNTIPNQGQGNINGSTWTIQSGSRIDTVNTHLSPFRKSMNDNDFYTCADVQNHKVFGSTYEEYTYSPGDKGAINSYINAFYGPQATATAGYAKRSEPNAAIEAVATAAPALPPSLSPDLFHANGSSIQYVTNIHAPRYTLGGTYTIYLFMGAPASEDPATWSTDKNMFFPVYVVSMPGMEHNEVIVTSSVTLTRTLRCRFDEKLIPGLADLHAIPYMQKNFQWRIQGPNGTAINPGDVKGFQIGVFSTSLAPITDMHVLPKWSKNVPLPIVTSGRPGGACLGDALFDPSKLRK